MFGERLQEHGREYVQFIHSIFMSIMKDGVPLWNKIADAYDGTSPRHLISLHSDDGHSINFDIVYSLARSKVGNETKYLYVEAKNSEDQAYINSQFILFSKNLFYLRNIISSDQFMSSHFIFISPLYPNNISNNTFKSIVNYRTFLQNICHIEVISNDDEFLLERILNRVHVLKLCDNDQLLFLGGIE